MGHACFAGQHLTLRQRARRCTHGVPPRAQGATKAMSRFFACKTVSAFANLRSATTPAFNVSSSSATCTAPFVILHVRSFKGGIIAASRAASLSSYVWQCGSAALHRLVWKSMRQSQRCLFLMNSGARQAMPFPTLQHRASARAPCLNISGFSHFRIVHGTVAARS